MYIFETDELLRFIQEAQEKQEHFNNLINMKKRNLRDSAEIREVNLKLTQNMKIINNALNQKFEGDNLVKAWQIVTKENQKMEVNKKRLSVLTPEIEQLQEIERFTDEKFKKIFQYSAEDLEKLQQRDHQFFTADETHVGDQCSICMEDIDVGRRMRRLTCDGQHYFCQECIEGWFAEHKTCPLCRHKFN